MKCTKCNSVMVFVDAETDMIWCETCLHTETVDYKIEPKDKE